MRSLYKAAIALFLIIFSGCVYGQTWQWATGAMCLDAGPSRTAECFTSSTDELGNTYLTGQMANGRYVFGNDTIVTAGVNNAFITRFDRSGKIVWTKIIKGGIGLGVAADHAGTVYAIGDFVSDSIRLGSILLMHNEHTALRNFYIFKLDSSGNAMWGKSGGGTYADPFKSVAVDDRNNLYFTCSYVMDTITLDAHVVVNNGPVTTRDVFLAKCDPMGNVLWARSFGGSLNEFSFGIAVGHNNDVFLSGEFSSPSITFGSGTVYNTTFSNVYLAKFDTAGNEIWIQGPAAGTNNKSGGVAVDDAGNAYMTGSYDSTYVTFGPYTLHNVRRNMMDGFFVKYDGAGNIKWAKNIGSYGYDFGSAVKKERNSQNIWLSGGFIFDTVNIDGHLLHKLADGEDNVFLAQFDTSGEILCTTTVRSGGDDWNGLGFDDSGHVYFGGDYMGDYNIVVGPDTLKLIDTNQEMPFVARFKPCFMTPLATLQPSQGMDIVISPNPAINELFVRITSSERGSITTGIYNMVGKKVCADSKMLYSKESEIVVPVKDLPPGLYIFELLWDRGVVRQKFIKE